MRTAQSLSIISLPAAEPSAGQLAGCSPPERPALSLKDQQELWKAARARMGAPLTPKVPVVKRPTAEIVHLSPLSHDAALACGRDYPEAEWFFHGVAPQTRRASIRDILHRTACEYLVSPSSLTGASRSREIVFARYVAMHRIANHFPTMSTPQIGRIFDLDHTSVLFALGRLARKPRRIEEVRAAV